MSDEVTPAECAKAQRDSDAAVFEELTAEVDTHCERTKHVLQALTTAVVPLDLTTAEVLVRLGHNMHTLIRTACDE